MWPFGGYDLWPNFKPLTLRLLLTLINGGDIVSVSALVWSDTAKKFLHVPYFGGPCNRNPPPPNSMKISFWEGSVISNGSIIWPYWVDPHNGQPLPLWQRNSLKKMFSRLHKCRHMHLSVKDVPKVQHVQTSYSTITCISVGWFSCASCA